LTDKNQLWEEALKVIKASINEKAFEAWFSQTEASGHPDGTLEISTLNAFSSDWLKENYRGLIKDVLFGLTKTDIEFSFSVRPLSKGVSEKAAPDIPISLKKTVPLDKNNLNPKLNFNEFVVGPNNRFAHAAAVAVSSHPAKEYNPLFIYGGVGLGKTHLMNAIGYKILDAFPHFRILYITSEKFTNQLIQAIQTKTTSKFREIYRSVDVLLLDAIHFIGGKESTQEEFFHTFNALYDFHKQIIVSSDRSPKNIKGLEDRLISRFEWGLVTDIQPPELETRIAILKKKCENITIKIPDEVLFFISENIKTNIRELEGALVRVTAHAKLIGDEITIPTVKRVLKDILTEEEKKISVDNIQKKVSEYFNIRILDLKSKKKSKNIVYPRQMAMYIIRKLTAYSLPEIGDFFGGRDHTTVLYSIEKIDKDIKSDKIVESDFEKLLNSIV